jgi:hyperosmotically inducible periplasmic protein
MRFRRTIRVPVLMLSALVALTAFVACSTNRPIGEQADDHLIASKVKAKLAADPEINPFNIDVDSVEGRVTLTGRVDDSETRHEAVKLARETAGVRGVTDRIRVSKEHETIGEHVDDVTITTKIKAKLAGDSILNAFAIDVDTNDGVVTLSGRVATTAARETAERIARDTQGVKGVHNDLKVGDRTS